MLTISWTDVAYTVGNLQISISFDSRSQGLAGGIFNVATRLGTSLSLALSSSVASAVSASYHREHPGLDRDAKEVLMAGFRAGGWVSVALAGAALLVCVFGIRGVGVIGAKVQPDVKPVEQEGRPEKLGHIESGAVMVVATGGENAAVDIEKPSVGGAQVVTLPSIRISADGNVARRASVVVSPGGRRSAQAARPSLEGSTAR